MDLTPEAIFGLLKSTDNFVVDLDDAWKWIGYSTKGNAKRLLEDEFEKGLDYITLEGQGAGVFIRNDKNTKTGRSSIQIRMTVACFKEFCMASRTSKGKEVRRYFRLCEEQLKEIFAARPKATLDQEWSVWCQRYDIRIDLKDRLRPELMNRVARWAMANSKNPQKICSEVHDAMNERIQWLKSQAIKRCTGLSVGKLIRDYFGTEPLTVYAAINKLTINFIDDESLPPLTALHKACDVYLSRSYSPKLLSLDENLYSQGKRLKVARKARELEQGKQLSLFLESQAS
jgi:phage anti-repressor protein